MEVVIIGYNIIELNRLTYYYSLTCCISEYIVIIALMVLITNVVHVDLLCMWDAYILFVCILFLCLYICVCAHTHAFNFQHVNCHFEAKKGNFFLQGICVMTNILQSTAVMPLM